jgi:hypothetical protein
MVSLSKPQEGLHLERENAGREHNVFLGNIVDKLFPWGGFDPILTVAEDRRDSHSF